MIRNIKKTVFFLKEIVIPSKIRVCGRNKFIGSDKKSFLLLIISYFLVPISLSFLDPSGLRTIFLMNMIQFYE